MGRSGRYRSHLTPGQLTRETIRRFHSTEGKISLSTPSHVSLLLQGTFNASISAAHISPKHWEFVYFDDPVTGRSESSSSSNQSKKSRKSKSATKQQRPATSDEDSDANGSGSDDDSGSDGEGSVRSSASHSDSTSGSSEDDLSSQSVGYWRNKKDGSRLGEADGGRVVFTVISMTIANHMLSLHGSLLKRPFSVPPPDEQAKRQLGILPGAGAAGLGAGFGFGLGGGLAGANANAGAAANGSANGSARANGSSGKRVRWHDEEEDEEDAAAEDGAEVVAGDDDEAEGDDDMDGREDDDDELQEGNASTRGFKANLGVQQKDYENGRSKKASKSR